MSTGFLNLYFNSPIDFVVFLKKLIITEINLSMYIPKSIFKNFLGIAKERIKLNIRTATKKINNIITKANTKANFLLKFIFCDKKSNKTLNVGLKRIPSVTAPNDIAITIPRLSSFALYSK